MEILKAEYISKSFGGVKALRELCFDLEESEVHGLVGQNGAGKSTLSRILYGDLLSDSGDIYLYGKKIKIRDVRDARANGISMIFQELRVEPYLTVMENIFLNCYITHPHLRGFVSWQAMYLKSKELMNEWGVTLNPKEILENLSVSQQQIVEILKNLYLNPKILIMDEPTSAMGRKDTDELFELIKFLCKKKNLGIIFISHNLDEVMSISDRITILRDGENVGTIKPSSIKEDKQKIIELMFKKEVSIDNYVKQDKKIDKSNSPILELKDLNKKNKFYNINFSLYPGEILGIAGILGSGKTELASTIFGLDKLDSGNIIMSGKRINIRSPVDAIKAGIVMIPEDRRKYGLFYDMSLQDNITFIVLRLLAKFKLIFAKMQKIYALKYIKEFDIKYSNLEQTIMELSGGNQQKVLISKWLLTNPNVILADQPTRGVDVNTKLEIYRILRIISQSNTGIILFSDEVEEILMVADRILVMNKGSIEKEYKKINLSQKELITAMSGS